MARVSSAARPSQSGLDNGEARAAAWRFAAWECASTAIHWRLG